MVVEIRRARMQSRTETGFGWRFGHSGMLHRDRGCIENRVGRAAALHPTCGSWSGVGSGRLVQRFEPDPRLVHVGCGRRAVPAGVDAKLGAESVLGA